MSDPFADLRQPALPQPLADVRALATVAVRLIERVERAALALEALDARVTALEQKPPG